MTGLSSMMRLIRPTETVAVAATLRVQGLHVFSSPVKFARLRSRSLPFHCLGGRCFKGEHWPDAVIREIREETGEALQLMSAPRTRLFTSTGDRGFVDLSDRPRPLCLYDRDVSVDSNFHHGHVRWLIGYRGRVTAQSLTPLRELAFILLLTDSMLRRTAQGHVSYRDIDNSADGSRLILKQGFQLDMSRVASPEGLALLLANRWCVSAATKTESGP